MTLSNDEVQTFFAESVGRPIGDDIAARVVMLASVLIDKLHNIDARALFLVEPSIVFGPTYPAWEEPQTWQQPESY